MDDHGDNRSRTVTLRFAATPEHLVLARLALAGVAAAEGVPSQVLSDLKLAVTEACANAVEHAYPRAGGAPGAAAGAAPAAAAGTVTVQFTAQPDAITVEVADDGAGFDHRAAAAAPARAEAGDAGRDRGLGLAIIQALVDDLSIASGAGGSRITFTKRFAPAAL